MTEPLFKHRPKKIKDHEIEWQDEWGTQLPAEEDKWDTELPAEEWEYEDDLDDQVETEVESHPRRAKYHARMDRFLTNGIWITFVLLILVLLIAFLL